MTVTVTCTASLFTIGGNVTGLTGTGLVLQDNGGDNLSISGAGNVPFTFATSLAAGSTYNVTVKTQPSGQACTVTNGTGTANANVTNVTVTCAATYTIGGTVTGLTGTGLVLQDNGTDNLTITGTGTVPFTFATALQGGSTYNVTVKTQPTGQRLRSDERQRNRQRQRDQCDGHVHRNRHVLDRWNCIGTDRHGPGVTGQRRR